MVPWQQIFSQSEFSGASGRNVKDLGELKQFLDMTHLRNCLVRPYQEVPDYPLVEARELLPSFETDMFEHKNLPAFSMVAFDRQLDYFSEVFQFDKLNSPCLQEAGNCCPMPGLVNEKNLQILLSRLAKHEQKALKEAFSGKEVTSLASYERLLPFLLDMDRAQVLAKNTSGNFHLAGIYASFPSDIDSELKRFGIRIGKFMYGDSELYERNRMFVLQFLMELYGFPIVSERRTASALFARKLHKMGENYLLRVLGQTDRVITTFINRGENRRYPIVEKQALVVIPKNQRDAIKAIAARGFFLDERNHVVIMRIRYRQHRYDPNNLQQDRALSVDLQEIIHPMTGEALTGFNIIKDNSSIFLRLNDIVRGEYSGRIVYKFTEVVENTDTEEKRLKFLYTWLVKHQRRMISYNDEFYQNVCNVINSYLKPVHKSENFHALRQFYSDVASTMSYISQARRVRNLQDIANRNLRGKHITYQEMSAEAVRILQDLQFELVNFFPDLVENIIKCVQDILHNRYLLHHYIEPPENALTQAGLEIRKNYGRIVALLDAIKGVRQARLCSLQQDRSEASVA